MKIGILGCGNMGKAYLSSLIKNGVFAPTEILVCNRTEAKNELIKEEFGVHTTTSSEDLAQVPTIILGIKPQGLQVLSFSPAPNSLIISLLVGTTVETLQQKFPHANIVRFMPNIGQYFGLGMTGVYSRSITLPLDQGELPEAEGIETTIVQTVHQIATAGSKAIWLKTEEEINNLAAISGSGPAYFFAFAAALKQSAESLGFDGKTSTQLALQTFLGAAEFIKQKKSHLSNLTSNLFTDCIATVASKGGTTQEALKTFKDKGLDAVVAQGVQAAVKRGEELAKRP